MTDRPYDDEHTEYDDIPPPAAYDAAQDDRSFGWEDEVPAHGGGRGGGGGGGGRPPRFAAPRARRSRGPRIVLGLAVAFLVLLLAVGVWVRREIDPSGSAGAPHAFVVPAGASSKAIGKLLEDKGIISSSFVWEWYLRINGNVSVEAGEYQLGEHSSMGDVKEALARGPVPPEFKRFTVPEGFTVKQTLARLADPAKGLGLSLADLQQALAGGQVRSTYQPDGETSNEGILFPETYEVEPDATPLQVLQQMVAELDTTLAALDVTSAETTYHLSPYEILTVASLIEEETKVPEERAKVARVIYNRIKQGIPLGIDATSRYEAELAGRDRSKVDFTSSSPYNTRKHKGLPPTPIAAPGRASIEAALHPADGPWTYYVLQDSSGHHFFTASDSEFIAAKRRCHDAGLGCG